MKKVFFLLAMLAIVAVSAAQSNDDIKADIRIDVLKSKIYQALDSVSKTADYVVVDNVKIFNIASGEFLVDESVGIKVFEGTVFADKYKISKCCLYWNRLGKKFDVSFGAFHHDSDVTIRMVEPRLVALLNCIQNK